MSIQDSSIGEALAGIYTGIVEENAESRAQVFNQAGSHLLAAIASYNGSHLSETLEVVRSRATRIVELAVSSQKLQEEHLSKVAVRDALVNGALAFWKPTMNDENRWLTKDHVELFVGNIGTACDAKITELRRGRHNPEAER